MSTTRAKVACDGEPLPLPTDPDALDPSASTRTWAHRYVVFVQRTDARIDIVTLERQADRFFRTKVGFMTPKAYGDDAPATDHASIAVKPPGRDTTARKLFVRPATEDEHVLAERLEIERSVTGLGALARRCPYVFEIERTADDDEAALVLAAIVASTFLGPILDENARDLFGVKTARIRLNGLV